MTKENVLRLYKHYKEIGRADAIADLEEKRPWLKKAIADEEKPVEKPKEEAKPKEKK